MTIPVSSSRLHRRAVECGGRQMREVSLFPFFDGTGGVRRIVAVSWEDGEIYMVTEVGKIPLLGRIRIPGSGGVLSPIRRGDVAELSELWHFDPWWVLDEPSFAGLRGREDLKQTNCVGRSRSKLAAVYYWRDLSAVAWVAYDDIAGGLNVGRWDARLLPARSPAVPDTAAAGPFRNWTLDPVWNRWKKDE